jgi:hypothetical protein
MPFLRISLTWPRPGAATGLEIFALREVEASFVQRSEHKKTKPYWLRSLPRFTPRTDAKIIEDWRTRLRFLAAVDEMAKDTSFSRGSACTG